MDEELSTSAGDPGKDIKAEHGYNTSLRPGKPGRRQETVKPLENPVELLCKTVRHFLPGFSTRMNGLPDPRKAEMIVYSQSHLLWNGILMFMMHLGSRRQMRHERLTDTFIENINSLAGGAPADFVADPDTLAYYAASLSVESAESLLAHMTQRLNRSKALDSFRLKGYHLVAIDATGQLTFQRKHCNACLHQTHSSGKTIWFHNILEAKLITSSGMALSMASEPITNDGKTQYDKQDCELRAFERLEAKLKKLFPRTKICLLLDGIYANQNVIRICERNGWKYFITFKEGSMTERYAEAKSLLRLQKNCTKASFPDCEQTISWVDSLPIAEFTPNVLFCRERKTGEKGATTFVWLTNFHICKNNAEALTNKGGRLRWKIENEGFKVQKKDGYDLEHTYSENNNAARVLYLLLQIAHYLTQLILNSNLIISLAKTFGSAKNFARRLAESMRNYPLSTNLVMPGQIRFSPP